MSDENADSKIDELTSKACEMSLAIQDLLEKNDPSIFEEYLKFYQVAVDALDLNEARMSDMKRENEYLVDDVSSKLEQLQNLSEDMTQYEAEIERTKQENIKFNAQIEVQKNLNEDLRAKLNKRKQTIPKLKDIARKIEIFKNENIEDDENEGNEVEKQNEIRKQIEELQKKITDNTIYAKSIIKKNQMKEAELKAKIKKTKSSSNFFEPKSPKKAAGPSMIIHRTQDSQADEVRLLHTSMEEALRTNATVKAQLSNLSHDLDAVREENTALKALMRNVIADKK